MKHLLTALLVALFSFGLAACGDGGSNSGAGSVITLTDANGNPVTIVSTNKDNKDGEVTTLTDSNGNPITSVE